jgi:hypothetical protein
MAGDVSLAGHWIARVAAGSVVKMCLAPAMSILWDARKNFWEMSKRAIAKRQHHDAAKVSGPISNKNEIEL